MRLLNYLYSFALLLGHVRTTVSAILDQGLAKHEGPVLSPRHIVRHPPVKRFSAVDSNRNSFVIHQLTAGIIWGVRFYAYEAVEQTSQQVARAAEDLVAFYSATLALAKVVWAHDTPKSVRRAHWNGLSLIFWSDSPIPFDFVDAFLSHIIQRTHSRFVGGYEMSCVSSLDDTVVKVALLVP
ncbi:MAG: hypothetical protein L6R37_003078 [Teloschistes peruensis]|nr:MAG: hypothetical protein L6R37_003078 [Teloschistes peruensis]